MENKGLCISCNSDKTCVFPRRFPVLHCEEYSDYVNHRYAVKTKLRNTSYSEQLTEEE